MDIITTIINQFITNATNHPYFTIGIFALGFVTSFCICYFLASVGSYDN